MRLIASEGIDGALVEQACFYADEVRKAEAEAVHVVRGTRIHHESYQPTAEDLAFLRALDRLGGAAAEALAVLSEHHQKLRLEAGRFGKWEQALQQHVHSLRARAKLPPNARSYQASAANDAELFRMRSDAQMGAALVGAASAACRKAVEAASELSAKCVRTAQTCSAAMHALLRSPARLSIRARLMAWEHGMDQLITALCKGEIVLEVGRPSIELMRGKYLYDPPPEEPPPPPPPPPPLPPAPEAEPAPPAGPEPIVKTTVTGRKKQAEPAPGPDTSQVMTYGAAAQRLSTPINPALDAASVVASDGMSADVEARDADLATLEADLRSPSPAEG